MIDLVLSVKISDWRMHDPEAESKNQAYLANRGSAVARDACTCQGCSFPSRQDIKAVDSSLAFSGYMEVHHRDNDHSNNTKENLITICPYCHEVFHAGNATMSGRAKLIWLPDIPQVAINRACHAIFHAIVAKTDQQHAAVALYERLDRIGSNPPARIPRKMLSVDVFGKTLARLSPQIYANRTNSAIFNGFKLLPIMSAHTRYIEYWETHSWGAIGDWSLFKDEADTLYETLFPGAIDPEYQMGGFHGQTDEAMEIAAIDDHFTPDDEEDDV